jgi:hypothetical protein
MARYRDRFAIDGSLTRRRKDANGYLHVDCSHISKEAVNPYLGREVPGWESLGLDPDRVYAIYRPAEELERAAFTFEGLPLLLYHHEIDAENPQPEWTVGSTGTGARFVRPYLDNALSITVAEAIEAVESGACRELSCAYQYTPVLEAGEFEGEPYDIIMRDIKGNHVALVDEGRAGPDVAVADARTVDSAAKEGQMPDLIDILNKTSEVLEATKAELGEAVSAAIGDPPKTPAPAPAAPDETPPAAQAQAEEPKADSEGQAPPAEEPAPDADPAAALEAFLASLPDPELAARLKELIAATLGAGQAPAPDAEPAAPPQDEAKPEDEAPPEEKPADKAQDRRTPSLTADAALVASVRKEVEREMLAKARAAQDVRPLVGEVNFTAFDSPADIYRKAIEASGRKTAVRDPQALREMVGMLAESRAAAKGADLALDSKSLPRVNAGLHDIDFGVKAGDVPRTITFGA